MNVLLDLTSLLALSVIVLAEAPPCPDQNTKDLLQKYKVNKEITPLLKGHTYVNAWRGKETVEYIDCTVTTFTADGDGVTIRIHNVKHDGGEVIVTNKWKENKGEGSFSAKGEIDVPDEPSIIVNENVHIFYADEYVFGHFSCDLDSKFTIMAISIRKDKGSDSEALKSLQNAEEIMTKLKEIAPDEMKKSPRKKCPTNI